MLTNEKDDITSTTDEKDDLTPTKNDTDELTSTFDDSDVGTDILDENLAERVRGIVRSCDDRKAGICLPSPLCGKVADRSVVVKIIWGAIYMVVFVLFLFNFVERLCYFFTYPKWTDVYMREVNFSDPRFQSLFPAVTICSHSSRKFAKLRDDLKVEIKKYGLSPTKMFGCLNAISDVIEFECGSVNNAWEASDLVSEIANCTSYPAKNLQYEIKSVSTTLGKCALVKIKEFPRNFQQFDILFNASDYACSGTKSPILIHHPAQLPDIRSIIALPGINGILEFYPVFKTIKYLSTSNDPCVTNQEFDKCYDKCIAEKIRKNKNITCGFPFFPDSVGLEPCNGSKEAKGNYSEAVKIYFSVEPTLNCSCPKPCEVHANFYAMQAFLWPREKWDKQTLLSFVLKSRHATMIEEQLAFDLATFFAEIGGLFALILGFSILTVVDFIYHGFKLVTAKKNFIDNRCDPLYDKVVKLMSKCRRSWKKPPFHTSGLGFCFSSAHILFKIIWVLVFLICVIATAIFVYGIIMSKPIIRNVFRLNYEIELKLPGVALCGDTNKLYFVRKKAAKKLNVNSTSLCLIDFIDVSEGMSQTVDLWSKNNFDDTYFNLNEIGEYIGGFPLIKSFNHTTRVLPHGKCTYYYDVDGSGYAPTTTIFPTMSLRVGQSCLDTAEFYLTTINTNDVEYFNQYNFRQGGAAAFQIFPSKISRLNLTDKPCVDDAVARKCQKNCVAEKIKTSTALECRLPYMFETSIPDCTSAATAKTAQLEYFKLRYSPTKCDCPLSCNHMYSSVHQGYEVLTKRELAAFVSISFGQNYVEEITQVSHDMNNIGKKYCNVGAVIGIFLGFSSFTVIYWLYSILTFGCNRSSRNRF